MNKKVLAGAALGGGIAALVVLIVGGKLLVNRLSAGGTELQQRLTAQGGALSTQTTNLCKQAAREALQAEMSRMGITPQWIQNVSRIGRVVGAAA